MEKYFAVCSDLNWNSLHPTADPTGMGLKPCSEKKNNDASAEANGWPWAFHGN